MDICIWGTWAFSHIKVKCSYSSPQRTHRRVLGCQSKARPTFINVSSYQAPKISWQRGTHEFRVSLSPCPQLLVGDGFQMGKPNRSLREKPRESLSFTRGSQTWNHVAWHPRTNSWAQGSCCVSVTPVSSFLKWDIRSYFLGCCWGQTRLLDSECQSGTYVCDLSQFIDSI